MREVKTEAKTVQSAVEKALQELGLRRDQVEVVIQNEGSAGFLGIGGKPAAVLVREKKWQSGEAGAKPELAPQKAAAGVSYAAPRGGSAYPAKPRNFRDKPARRDGGPRRPPRREHADRRPSPNMPPSPEEEALVAKLSEEIKNRPVPPEMAANVSNAEAILREILAAMDVEPQAVCSRWDPVQERVIIDFDCACADMFISRDAQALQSLQYLVTLITTRKNGQPTTVQVDIKNHWRQVEARVISCVNRGIGLVKRTNSVYRLEPMPPSLRRYIHKMFSGNTEIETVSEGEGKWRKIVLRPKQAQKN